MTGYSDEADPTAALTAGLLTDSQDSLAHVSPTRNGLNGDWPHDSVQVTCRSARAIRNILYVEDGFFDNEEIQDYLTEQEDTGQVRLVGNPHVTVLQPLDSLYAISHLDGISHAKKVEALRRYAAAQPETIDARVIRAGIFTPRDVKPGKSIKVGLALWGIDGVFENDYRGVTGGKGIKAERHNPDRNSHPYATILRTESMNTARQKVNELNALIEKSSKRRHIKTGQLIVSNTVLAVPAGLAADLNATVL